MQKGEAHSGHFCVRLDGCERDSCFIHKVPVQPGKVYALRCFARTSRPGHPDDTWVRVRWNDEKHAWTAQEEDVLAPLRQASVGAELQLRPEPSSSSAPTWQPIVTVFRAPESARYLVLLLMAKDQEETDASWFDDVLLVPVPDAG